MRTPAVLVLCLISILPSGAFAEQDIPSFYRLPSGSWEEKNGATRLNILKDNYIQLSFVGEFQDSGCQLEVYGALRNEYMARPGQCVEINYDRLHFAFEGSELILTLVNLGANYREVILVREGSTQDAPDI